jgi:hypothetical protein
MGVNKKNQILAQNPKVSAFGFTKNYNLWEKIERNSIFHDRKAHILDQLHVMVPYISFYGL